MDDTDRRIVNQLQDGFPICERPFAAAAARLGIAEDALIARLGALLGRGVLTRFGPLFDVERLGGAYTLAALHAAPERYAQVAARVNAFPEVAHNYQRDHHLNMWMVLAAETPEAVAPLIARIEADTGCRVLEFPREAAFALDFRVQA
ncbi:MAG: Lrp/AsnC family transcriptional regulator [Pseudomonadota bacterium]